jgi:mono/diheme cytochrome c family protein
MTPVARIQARRSSHLYRRLRFGVLVAGVALLGFVGPGLAQTSPGTTPGFTAAQAKRGAEFYAGACAVCHGDGLDDGQYGPPLKGPVHAAYWSGKTAGDVFTYMATMMPPTQPGSLGVQAYADIFAYVLQVGGAAPGDKELSSDPTLLRSNAPTR